MAHFTKSHSTIYLDTEGRLHLHYYSHYVFVTLYSSVGSATAVLIADMLSADVGLSTSCTLSTRDDGMNIGSFVSDWLTVLS